jgi:hypothetical protein
MPTKSRLIGTPDTVPPIELLIVAAEKDFWLLREVSGAAIRNSINPIESLTIVVPDSARSRIPNLEDLGVEVFVIDEETLLSKQLLDELRATMGTRSGWLLQQYLTIKFVEESRARGVLTIDADTFLLQKTLWLDSQGRQVLHVSSEFEPQYYRFLHHLRISELAPEHTHVTHHMLMQPDLLRAIFKSAGISGSEDVLKRALSYCMAYGQSVFCLEFELYAQGCKKLFRYQLELLKFGNRSVRVRREAAMKDLSTLTKSSKNKFRTLSAHSYAQVTNSA